MAIEASLVHPLLQPLIALTLWTFLIEIWMYCARHVPIVRHDVEYTPHFNRQYSSPKIPLDARCLGDKCNSHGAAYAVLCCCAGVSVFRLGGELELDQTGRR